MAKKIDKPKLAEAIEEKMAKKVKKFKPNPNDDPRPGVANPVLPHGPTPISTGGGGSDDYCGTPPHRPPHLGHLIKDEIVNPVIQQQGIAKEEILQAVHPLNEAIRKPSAVLKEVAAGKVNAVAKGVKTKKK